MKNDINKKMCIGLLLTLVLGLLSSILIACQSKTLSSQHLNVFLISFPSLLALICAFFQYKYLLLPYKLELEKMHKSVETAAKDQAETRVREQALIQHAVDVICVIDLKGTILSVNPASKSMWGYKQDELVGKQITDFIVGEDVDDTLKKLMGAEKSIDKIYFENRFRKKSGQIIELLWSVHLSASDRGLFCVAHDITERKLAEKKLKESEERVRGILQSLPAGVAVVENNDKVIFLNSTALELTSYVQENISQLKACDLFSFCRTNPSLNNSEMTKQQVVQNNFLDEANIDCQIMRSTGERFPAEASLRNFRFGDKNAQLVIFMDVTQKHELETAKREFVSMIGHDLKTPLTSIYMIFCSLIEGVWGALEEEAIEFAGRGKEACDRLISLVQDLLDLEKMKAGKFSMDQTDTNITVLIKAAVEALEPYSQSQGIKLVYESSNEQCFCDGGRIIQVLINLLGNAIKFSETDGTVSVCVEHSDNLDKYIKIVVMNKGRLIPQEKLLSIFEKFEQADAKGAQERKGTGLGLAISRTIIEQHGGKIWAESSSELGTRFSFTVPITSSLSDSISLNIG